MTYRVRNIGIAVALAAVAALFTSFYVTSYKRHVQRGEDRVTVLVAKSDIKEGTSGGGPGASGGRGRCGAGGGGLAAGGGWRGWGGGGGGAGRCGHGGGSGA